MTNEEKGKKGESRVRGWLMAQGFKVSIQSRYSKYDLLVNGWRVEVKHCEMLPGGHWKFNIHRHGKLSESEVDFYIFSLENVPYSDAAIYLIKEAPLGIKTLNITFRSLLVLHCKDIHNVEVLRSLPPPLVRSSITEESSNLGQEKP